ncbi:hypothetical protein [Kutzneria albida]|uniref:Uncharacterized protein n=1 Tax=Kutzneria albida DSM 43870 TaxID=1449976 RepID=W5WCE3_9PSEU|nr:hypothetical protein [Kutzneria albida]AHH98567.1 hypothetical protein KALB_5205 [Kutzneria albida DSM 43870]
MTEGFRTPDTLAVGHEKAVLATWASDGKGGFTSGQLMVEPDRLPTVKATFLQAKDRFREMLSTAQNLRYLNAPGDDEVSKQAVDNLAKLAGGGEGCLTKTLNDCMARCDEMIANVDKSMQLYKVADTSAEIKFKS